METIKNIITEKDFFQLVKNEVLIIPLGYKKMNNDIYKCIEYGIGDNAYLSYIKINNFDKYNIVINRL